jgi:hypothetical protein
MAPRCDLIAAALVVIAGPGCHKDRAAGAGSGSAAPVAAPAPVRSGPLVVASVSAPLPIDGEWERDWNDRAARVVFAATGGTGEARPYSEMRLLRDGDALLVGLYAADEDIHGDEAFELAIGAVHLRADAAGRITPAIAGARVAIDLDGTRDQPGDYDEEWKLELSLPIAALGVAAGATVPVEVARCDTPKDGVKRCGEWRGALAPLR